jgi:hypothetical protein
MNRAQNHNPSYLALITLIKKIRTDFSREHLPRKTVSFGALSILLPHMGVSHIPFCSEPKYNGTFLCKKGKTVARYSVYNPPFRNRLVPAQYFKVFVFIKFVKYLLSISQDPKRYSTYLKYNKFLAYVNNEVSPENQAYKIFYSFIMVMYNVSFFYDHSF